MVRSPNDVAELIDSLKAYYVASTMGLLFLNHPRLPTLLLEMGMDRGSKVRLGRRDNSYYEGLDVYEAIAATRGNAGFNLDFLGALVTVAVSWVGDELAASSYFDRTPELEFFRHIRNGLSHGNRFHLLNGEPRRRANFRGFEITADLHEQTVLFEFISSGDVFDLLDHVGEHLRRLDSPSPTPTER